MGTIASHITSLTIVYSTVHSGADQRKQQSSTSLAFVRGIHQWPVNSPHKWPVTRRMFPFDDVIMSAQNRHQNDATSIGLIRVQACLVSSWIIARPKGGLYRYHVERINFTIRWIGFLPAIINDQLSCLIVISHWQSYCHKTGAVYQSIGELTSIVYATDWLWLAKRFS